MKGEHTQSLPQLKQEETGNIITDPGEKAELLNQFFVSQTKLKEKKTE